VCRINQKYIDQYLLGFPYLVATANLKTEPDTIGFLFIPRFFAFPSNLLNHHRSAIELNLHGQTRAAEFSKKEATASHPSLFRTGIAGRRPVAQQQRWSSPSSTSGRPIDVGPAPAGGEQSSGKTRIAYKMTL
jgi:hypothetical protein